MYLQLTRAKNIEKKTDPAWISQRIPFLPLSRHGVMLSILVLYRKLISYIPYYLKKLIFYNILRYVVCRWWSPLKPDMTDYLAAKERAGGRHSPLYYNPAALNMLSLRLSLSPIGRAGNTSTWRSSLSILAGRGLVVLANRCGLF